MFDLHVIHTNGKFGPYVRHEVYAPILPVRIQLLAWSVATELSALGYIYPNETPMHVMYEMVDMAVARHFPGMDEIAGNDRYVRLVVRRVGRTAFRYIEDFMS